MNEDLLLTLVPHLWSAVALAGMTVLTLCSSAVVRRRNMTTKHGATFVDSVPASRAMGLP